jgi:hypothetical protein
MTRVSFRRLSVLVLGLLVALGMGLSVVQAGTMATKMATAGHMASSSSDGCGQCGDQPGGTNKIVCEATCVAPAAATLPQFLAVTFDRATVFPWWRSARLAGLTASPDPSPPRPIDLA